MRFADNRCKCVESFEPTHTYTFTGNCIATGVEYSVVVKAEELYKYRSGALIQNAFPTMSVDDREFLMSGLAPEGFKQWSA